MTIGTLLALVCIILGFIAGIIDDNILFNALTWFVAAIAIEMTLSGVGPALVKFNRE